MNMRLIFIAIAVMIFAAPSIAQTVCGKHADVVIWLAAGYDEAQSSVGIAANGYLYEVFASKRGNWTITSTKPGGMTCLVATGQAWQTIKEPFKMLGLLDEEP